MVLTPPRYDSPARSRGGTSAQEQDGQRPERHGQPAGMDGRVVS